MLIERRIEKATKRTIDLFNKKNELRKEAEISIEWFDLTNDSIWNEFLDKELRKLERVNRKYEKAYSKLEGLEEQNNSRRIGIVEGVAA